MNYDGELSFAALVPARYILAILGSIGMAIIYGLKVNLSVAMVAMLNHTAISHHPSSTVDTLHHLHNATYPLSAVNSNADPECQGSATADTMEVCDPYYVNAI